MWNEWQSLPSMTSVLLLMSDLPFVMLTLFALTLLLLFSNDVVLCTYDIVFTYTLLHDKNLHLTVSINNPPPLPWLYGCAWCPCADLFSRHDEQFECVWLDVAALVISNPHSTHVLH